MASDVAAVFNNYPSPARSRLLELRHLILDTAGDLDVVGPLSETLRWGEISYLTQQSKSGTTIRIGWRPAQPDRYALFLNCNTSLIASFRATLGSDFVFEGSRAMVMELEAPLPREALRPCIVAALTYHCA